MSEGPSGRRPHSRDGSSSERQAFAGAGQFTGRPLEPQEGEAPASPPDQAQQPGQSQQPGQAQQPAQVLQPEWGGPPSPAPGQPGGHGVSVEQYEEAVRDRDEFRAHAQRIAAEFDNFRKRSIREREQAAAAADAKLLGELLTVLDDFERALQHTGEAAGSQFAEGIGMTQSRLWAVLEQHGLKEIDTTGKFDPHLHEAVALVPSPDAQEGDILQVAQKGYMLGDRPLRHSKVVVAGEPG